VNQRFDACAPRFTELKLITLFPPITRGSTCRAIHTVMRRPRFAMWSRRSRIKVALCLSGGLLLIRSRRLTLSPSRSSLEMMPPRKLPRKRFLIVWVQGEREEIKEFSLFNVLQVPQTLGHYDQRAWLAMPHPPPMLQTSTWRCP